MKREKGKGKREKGKGRRQKDKGQTSEFLKNSEV
jgi:hypothetical protein